MSTPTPPTKLERRILLALLAPAVATAVCGITAFAPSARADQIPPPPAPPVAPRQAPASLVVNAEIMVLHATMGPPPGSIDPAIGRMPQLMKPPFSVFNTYHLVDKKIIPLEVGKTGPYTLPNGRVLQVTFANPTLDKRFHIQVAINQPGGHAYLKLLEVTTGANETFFVAGQPYKGGVLVLGITLRP
jgi:hypothetical protein